MEVLHRKCAGLDVHKDTVVACVRHQPDHGRARTETRTFATHTAGRTLRYARIFGFSTLALLLVGGGLRLAFHYGEARALESRTAASLQRTVSTVTVRAGDATRRVTLPASLRGRSETTVYARSAGYLAAWHKTIGERVKKGELLATIDAPEECDGPNLGAKDCKALGFSGGTGRCTSRPAASCPWPARWRATMKAGPPASPCPTSSKSAFRASAGPC